MQYQFNQKAKMKLQKVNRLADVNSGGSFSLFHFSI
jgi:hypothetical protein